MIDDITMMNEGDVIGFTQCLCLPKSELNTKNETTRPLVNGWLVLFLVFNSITHVGKKVFHLTKKTVYTVISVSWNFFELNNIAFNTRFTPLDGALFFQ